MRMFFTAIAAGAFAIAMGAPQAHAETEGDVYSLNTCPVSGQELGSMGDPVILNHEGREIRLCCSGCTADFEENAAEHIAAIDAAMADDQRAFFPLTECLSMGGEATGDDATEIVVNNRLFRLCCDSCVDDVQENWAEYVQTVDEAVAEQQRDSYPLETCLVSGQALDSMGGPVEYVIANRLIKLCCAGCEDALKEDPAGMIAEVDAARS